MDRNGRGLTGNLKITITSHYILPSISACAEWDFKHLDQAAEVCLISLTLMIIWQGNIVALNLAYAHGYETA